MDHFNAIRGALTVGGTGNVTFAATGSGKGRPLSTLPTGWQGGIRFDDPNGVDWELSMCTALGSNVFSRDTLLTSSTGSKVNLTVGTIGLQTVLAEQLNAFMSTADIAFSAVIPLTRPGTSYMAAKTVGAPIVFTPAANAVRGSRVYLRIIADGTNIPDYTAFKQKVNSQSYNNTSGTENQVEFSYDGSNYFVVVSQALISGYARMKAALAAVSASTGYAKVGLLGDSTVAGAKAGTAGAAIRTTTPVTLLRDQLLSTQSRPAIASNWIGDQRFQVTNSLDPYTFDTRFSQPDGAGFIATTGATPVSVAGSLMSTTSSANRFGFLPEVATDTTDIYYAVNTTLGAFSVIRNGGASAAISQVGASGMGKTTYSSPLNSVDPIYLARTSGGVYVIGMDSYNSAIKSIRLFGLGWSGGRAADWAGTLTGFDPLNGLVALGLDLVVARFGTNDISVPGATTTSTDPTAYQASINKILDALAAAGTNVILATHYPMNTTVTAQAVQDTYAGYVRSIAAARGLKVHDTYARVGTWAAANTAGKMYDNLHPNAAGYTDDAVALASLILSIA